MSLAWLFLVISLHSTTEALQCNRYRERTIMNVAMNNKCYYAWPRKRGTYNEAVKLCQKGGTHVLFTETKEEHHRLLSRLGPAFTRIWIGLERNGSDWKWQGGQRSRPVEQLLFADNQASAEGHNAIVSKSKGKYIWQVQEPNNTFQIVCEQEPGKNTADRVLKDTSSGDRSQTSGALGKSESADVSRLRVPLGVTIETSATFNEEFTLVTISRAWSAESRLQQSDVDEQSINLDIYSNLGAKPVSSITPGQFSFDGRFIKADQTIKMDQTVTSEQSSNIGDSSFLEQVINPEQTIRPGQTFTPTQSSRGGDYNLNETPIASEQTVDQISDFTYAMQPSNLQRASVPKQNSIVIQDRLEVAAQKTTSMLDKATVSSSGIVSDAIRATTVPTPFSTTLPTGQYPGTDPLPSVDLLISSPIRTHIHSVRWTMGHRKYSLVVTESNQLSSPIHSPVNAGQNSIDLSVGSKFSTAFVGPSFITAISFSKRPPSAISSIGSFRISPNSSLVESSVPELSTDVESGSDLRLSLGLSSTSGAIGSAASSVIGPSASDAITSSTSGGVLSSSVPFVIRTTVTRATGSHFPTVFRSSTLHEILSSTSNVIATSASDQKGSFASGNIESSPFVDTDSSVSSLIRSAASGVIRSFSSGMNGSTASGVIEPSPSRETELSSSVFIRSANYGVIAPTSSDNVGPSVSGSIATSASVDINGFLAPVVFWPAGVRAIASFASSVFTSSTLDKTWSSTVTSDVSVASVSDLTGSFASGTVDSTAFGGSSASSLIRSTASGVKWSPTSRVITPTTSDVGLSASGAIASSSSDSVSGSLAAVVLWPAGTGAIVSFAPRVVTSSTLKIIGSSSSDMILTTVSDLSGPFVSGIIESSASDVMGLTASGPIKPSASGFSRLSSPGSNKSPFLSVPSAFDMPGLPVSAAFVSEVIGSYASGAVSSFTVRKTGSDALDPVSSRLLSSATLEGPADDIRIGSSVSTLRHAPVVLAGNKSDSTSPSAVFIHFNSSDTSLKATSLSLDTPTSSRPQAAATADPVQATIPTPTSQRDSVSVTTTDSFDHWTEISTSSGPILDSIPTILVTMSATSVARATSSAVLVGLAALQNSISTSTLSSARDVDHEQNNVPEILEAVYRVVANSSDHRNNIETFAFRKVTTITDVTMTTSFPATTTINCARLCASGQYECNIVMFKDRICRLYSV